MLSLYAHGGFGTVRLEKSKGVIGCGAKARVALGAVGEQKGLQQIYDLGDVTHEQLVCLAVENIQAKTGSHGAAHCALHPKLPVALLVILRNFVPHAPFVQDQADFVAVTVTVEERSLLRDRFFHSLEYRQLLVQVVRVEFRGTVTATFIIVHGKAAGSPAVESVHESARPLPIVSAGTAGHQVRLRSAVLANVHGELPV